MNRPKIRFKGFDGEWGSPSIDEIFEVRNGYTPSKYVSAYWIGGTIPWFRMEDIREHGAILSDAFQHITPLGVKGAGLFKANSIILATTATIGVHAMLIADSLANQRFTNFSIRKSLQNMYNPYFIFYRFYKVDEWALENTNSGGLLSVDVKGLLQQPFYSPSLPEQTQIARYFSDLDNQISMQEQKIATLKQTKQACLQSMFPQEGETTPRIRFKGFSGEWEKVKMEDVCNFYKGNGLSKEKLSESGKYKCILYGEIFTKYDFEIKECVSQTNYKEGFISESGDVIMPGSTTTTGIDLAKAVHVPYDNILYGGDIIVLRPINKDMIDSYFLATNISCVNRNQIAFVAQGSTIVHLHAHNIAKLYYMIPSYDEQKAIATFFSNLDKQIDLQEQKLEKLKCVKGACLNKMFI